MNLTRPENHQKFKKIKTAEWLLTYNNYKIIKSKINKYQNIYFMIEFGEVAYSWSCRNVSKANEEPQCDQKFKQVCLLKYYL